MISFFFLGGGANRTHYEGRFPFWIFFVPSFQLQRPSLNRVNLCLCFWVLCFLSNISTDRSFLSLYFLGATGQEWNVFFLQYSILLYKMRCWPFSLSLWIASFNLSTNCFFGLAKMTSQVPYPFLFLFLYFKLTAVFLFLFFFSQSCSQSKELCRHYFHEHQYLVCPSIRDGLDVKFASYQLNIFSIQIMTSLFPLFFVDKPDKIRMIFFKDNSSPSSFPYW